MIRFIHSKQFIDYPDALQQMCHQPPCVWFLQHPHMYSLGNRGKEEDINNIYNLPVYASPRGGQVTYHGPGQLMVYCFFDLRALGMTVHEYVTWLESIIIQTLADFGIKGETGPHPGIWVNGAKIASIGIRIQRHVTSHGFALNVCNDLKYFAPIRTCGIEQAKVTSMTELGVMPMCHPRESEDPLCRLKVDPRLREDDMLNAVIEKTYPRFFSTNSQFTRFSRNLAT